MPARKKPLTQHRIEGTYRADRHGPLPGDDGCDKPRHRPPPKPADLDPDAAEHWDFLAPLLTDTLTERDGMAFRQLCELLARQRKLWDVLATIPATDPHALRLLRLVAAGTDRLLKFSEKFGLTPLGRQNLRVADPGPPVARVATRPRTAFDRMGAPGKPPAAD